MAYINRTLYAKGQSGIKRVNTTTSVLLTWRSFTDKLIARQYDRMDPILSAFLVAAVVAISFLVIVNIYIYVEYYKVQEIKDSCTQTVSNSYQTVSTHTTKIENQEKGYQFPEAKTIVVDRGCDAQPLPRGAVITEQIQELCDTQVRLQEYMSHLYSRTNTDLERFTKEILEQSVMQCQTFQAHRDDLLVRFDILQADIQKSRKETRTDLHKIQETIQYEVCSGTHNVVHQLLSILPPPPPPLRPWLYLPYGQHTRSGEVHAERKAPQDHFWSQRRQMNAIAPEEEDAANKEMEQEDDQSLDYISTISIKNI